MGLTSIGSALMIVTVAVAITFAALRAGGASPATDAVAKSKGSRRLTAQVNALFTRTHKVETGLMHMPSPQKYDSERFSFNAVPLCYSRRAGCEPTKAVACVHPLC